MTYDSKEGKRPQVPGRGRESFSDSVEREGIGLRIQIGRQDASFLREREGKGPDSMER